MEEEDLKRKKKSLNDKSRLAKASENLATYYYKHGRYSDALCEYQLQLSIYAELGLQMEWAACHRMIGEMYFLMAEFEKAIKFVKHHLSVVKELEDVPEELKAMETLGRIYLKQGESSNKGESKTSLIAAENAFMTGLALCETYQSKTSNSKKHNVLDTQVRILTQVGVVQVQLDFIDKGIEFIKKAITICLNEDFYDELHRCYTIMAYLHRNNNDYATALSYLNRALAVSSRFKEKDLKICDGLSTKADILCKMSDYRGAKEVLRKAWKLKTHDEKERKNIESNLKIVIAMCETEDLLKTSDTSDHTALKKLYDKLGDGACCLKNYAAALKYYFKELEHAELAGDCGRTLGPIFFSLFKTYRDMGCYNEALVYWEKEYELFKDEPKYAIVSLTYVAEVLYLARKPYHLIEKAYIDIRALIKKINYKRYEITLLNRLLSYQKAYGEKEKMKVTKLELKALKRNLKNSEDKQRSDGDVSDTNTTHVGDDVRLEDLPDFSDTDDMEVVEKKKETKDVIITKNSKGETTLLHRACRSGNKHDVESLLTGGCPVNQRDHAGWLPLHEACLYGRLEIVNMLINSGADVNDKGGPKCHGTTPLHDAASNGHLDVVQLLLEKGAIPSFKSDFNETSLDVLQKWRTKQSKLTKEKEKTYKYICNKITNFIKNSGGVNYDTSDSKIPVKPIKDISLPSTSKSSNNIQDVIIIDDSDEEIIESQNNKNQSALATNDTNKNKVTKEIKAKKIKKERNSWVRYDIDVYKNISNSDNFQCNENTVSSEVNGSESILNASRELNDGLIENTGGIGFDTSESKTHVKLIKDISMPSTSKMVCNIEESQIKFYQILQQNQSSNHPISASKNNTLSKITREKANKCIPALTPNEMGNDELENDLDRNKKKYKSLKHRKPLSVTKEHPLDKHKNSCKNTTEPVEKTNKSQKPTKSRIRPDVNVNEKSSYSDCNLATESMLNTSREIKDSLIIRTNGGVDVDILKSKNPLKAVKDLSRFTTSNKNSNTQDFLIFDDSLDSSEFPVVEVKKSKPALLTLNDMVNDLDANNQNNEKNSSPFLINDENNIENINKVTEPLVENKKRTKRKKSRVDVDANKNSSNSNNSQDKDNVCSEVIAAKSMLNISKELNDNLVDNNGGVDFNTSSPPLKDNTSLPSTLEISNYIQESQNKKNRTAFPLKDTQSSDHQSVYHKTKISSDNTLKNASEFPKNDVNKSAPALLTPSDVDNDKLDKDLTKNKHNYDKKRKLSDPLNVAAKKRLLDNRNNNIENVNEITQPLIESKKNKKQKKPRISDNVGETPYSSNYKNSQGNENMFSEVFEAKSMINTSQKINDSIIGGGFNFDTSKFITPAKSIKGRFTTSKIGSNKQNKNQKVFLSGKTESLDAQTSNHVTELSGVTEDSSEISTSINKNANELAADVTNKSVPTLISRSDMCNNNITHDLGKNKQNKIKKNDKNDNRLKRIENINNIIEVLAESKKRTKRKQLQVSDDVKVNINNFNSDNFQENHEVHSTVIANESMVNTIREFNDDLIKNTCIVDFNRQKPKTAVNSILNVKLPSLSEINDYIQESQNNINQTVFSEDTHSLNHQSVFYETEISNDEACRIATLALNRNISKFSEGDRNKSIPTLFTPYYDELDDDLGMNIQNKMKKKNKKTDNKKKNYKKKNGKLSDPTHRDTIENINKLIEPEIGSKKSTKEKKTRVGDAVGVSENSIDAGNENLYPSVIAAKSLTNCRNEETLENNCNTNDGFNAVENMNSNTNHLVNVIQPVNLSQISNNMQTQNIQTVTVKVHIENEVELIALDLDAINMLTISWLVDEVKSRYYKLKDTCPVFNLMTSEGAILYDNEPLKLVLSSPELYTCLTNFNTSPTENRYLESCDALGIHDTLIKEIEEDVQLFSLLDNSSQPTSPHPEHDESGQLNSLHRESPQLTLNIQNNKKRKLSDPSAVIAKKNLLDNHKNELIEPKKSQVSDFVGVSENSFDAENENMWPKIIAVVSLANCKDKELNGQPVTAIQPIHIDHTFNMQTQIICPAAVKVHIEDVVELIPLDFDTINMLTISWLVDEVKCSYYKLKGTCPVFNLMTLEGAILCENEPLNLVLSSPELYTCLTNIKTSPAEDCYLDSYDVLGIHDAVTRDSTDDVQLFFHNESTQSTSPRDEPHKPPQPISPRPTYDNTPRFISSQPESSHLEPQIPSASLPEHNELPKHTSSLSPHPTCSSPKEDESLQPVLYAGPPRPGSLAHSTSPDSDIDPVIPLQSVSLDELELDDQTLQLLGVVPRTETHLGPPIHKVVAKSWQEILAQGLQKEDTDQIMEVYSVPANCDLLLAPTLNPEVNATIRENTLNVDSSLMEQQKQLGLAISALGTAVNSILLNETSKQMILKPISDACRLLCDIHFRETETRRHNVITSANPELKHLLVNTVRGSRLFGDNEIKTEKFIQQSGEASDNVPKPAFNIFFNKPLS